jgi:hypothetical protein
VPTFDCSTEYSNYRPHSSWITVRIHNQFRMPSPNSLIGKCFRGSFNVCTFRSNFHLFLSNLGKTSMTDPAEYQYFGRSRRTPIDLRTNTTTKRRVFLYEVSQLSDKDSVRGEDFRRSLQTFLHLTVPLDPMIWYKPGKVHDNANRLARLNAQKMNICDPHHQVLHRVLMEQAVNASRWIRNYFLDAPDVVVSSKEYLRNTILASWERDPCLDRIWTKSNSTL